MEARAERAGDGASLRELSELVERESVFVEQLMSEIGRVIVGQRDMVESLLVGMLCGGHVLLEGVPGLAKTLAVNTLASCVQGTFKRIQFSPDLLPADLVAITGAITSQVGRS